MIYEQPCEENTYYQPGGYHPVHLGDTFHDDAYQVVHKLGYGQSSTLWLVLCHIRRNGSTSSSSEFILQLIDKFEHTGRAPLCHL